MNKYRLTVQHYIDIVYYTLMIILHIIMLIIILVLP